MLAASCASADAEPTVEYFGQLERPSCLTPLDATAHSFGSRNRKRRSNFGNHRKEQIRQLRQHLPLVEVAAAPAAVLSGPN